MIHSHLPTSVPRCRRATVAAVLVLAAVLAAPLPPHGAYAANAANAAVPGPPEPAGVWPLDPEPLVVHGFEPPAVRWEAGHRGVDLAGRIGQRVRTALPGTVSFARPIAGVGVVVVDHGATRTTYQPVMPSVQAGQRVRAGDVLGRLTWFGTHCLPAACLHWGLITGDRYLDPLTLVGGPRPVRLLPLRVSDTGSRWTAPQPVTSWPAALVGGLWTLW